MLRVSSADGVDVTDLQQLLIDRAAREGRLTVIYHVTARAPVTSPPESAPAGAGAT